MTQMWDQMNHRRQSHQCKSGGKREAACNFRVDRQDFCDVFQVDNHIFLLALCPLEHQLNQTWILGSVYFVLEPISTPQSVPNIPSIIS